MLVLSRRINESIQIGTDIEVINAPQSTQIWRKDLWDVIVSENKAAAEGAKSSGIKEAPQLPLSTFSKLSKIPTVHVNKQAESLQK